LKIPSEIHPYNITEGVQRVVVVLGVHRSGTSVITRGLKVLGVELGNCLMPPVPHDNDKGFFEDQEINTINIEMLRTLGKNWNSLTPLSCGEISALHENGYFDRCVSLLKHKIGDIPIFGFKDPRTVYLLQFWKNVFDVLPYKIHYVITLRHPLSVVQSLNKRNGFDSVRGYFFWLEHVLTILSGTEGEKKIFVDYDRMVLSPEIELERIATELNLTVNSAELEIYRNDFLDLNLRHTFYDREILNRAECPPLVAEVYTTLKKVAADKLSYEDKLVRNSMIGWLHQNESHKTTLKLLDRVSQSLREAHLRLLASEAKFSTTAKIAVLDENRILQVEEITELCESRISALQADNYRRGEWILRLDREINLIKSSFFWKIGSWLDQTKISSKRFAVRIMRLTRAFYMHLPLDIHTRTAHKLLILKYFSKLEGIMHSPIGTSLQDADLLCEAYAIEDMEKFAAELCLPVSERPTVSIIIPVFGQCDYTLRCLASISNHLCTTRYEIIVVDDGSPDGTAAILETVKNIHLLRLPYNQGFIRSCNAGANEAKGQFLCFLNNDTQVMNGWLDELVRTFDEFPGTGLAGSKLLYPDGRLQEAGCIIWRDGSAWNFGRGQKASLPVFNYAREVDYCSGASIMLPRHLFEEIGGFDEHFSPAYCEDADLALKIRERGHRVIYQPLSVVIHFEGVTSGTDVAHGVKAYQTVNTKKLALRWQFRLKKHQENSHYIDAAKDRRATRRVLVIDHRTPSPDQDSGSIDVYNTLLLLREMELQATFIPEDNFLFMPPYTPALQRLGVETLFAPYVSSIEQHLKDFGPRYDLVVMFRVGVVQRHLGTVKKYCSNAKIIFNTVDLHYLRIEREAILLKDNHKLRTALEIKKFEHQAIRSTDITTVVSSEELKRLRLEVPDANIRLMPFCRHIPGTRTGFAQRSDIVFVGGFEHPPNIDAVCFFVSDIFPRVRKLLPGVRFHIVGSKTTDKVRSLAAEDIIVTGFVENLSPLLERMRLSVAPLRYGAGIKGKIATALSHGLPVVSTSLAAEGMSLVDGETILIADTPETFAHKVYRLYSDESLWSNLSRGGLAFAEQAWGPEAAWIRLESILMELGFPRVPSRYSLKLYTEGNLKTPL
jgi:O-antigen biosynthesis protein